MKKKSLFAVVAAFAMGVLLVGCIGGPAPGSPTQVATDFLKAVKANDTTTMAKYYDGDVDEELDLAWLEETINESDELTPEMRASAKALYDKIRDFDFKVSNEKIEGDKAHVDVEIKTYNFGTFFKDVFSDFVGKALTMALSGGDVSEAQFEAELAKVIDNNMNALKDKSFTTTVPLYLTKTSDGWKIEELDDSFVDAVMGGLLSALGDFASMFGNLGGGAIDNPFAGGDDFDFSDIFGDSDSGNPFDTLAPLAA